MRVFIMAMAFAMCSCATQQPQPVHNCPDLPKIGEQQTLKDYVLLVVGLYQECQK
jgi:hypothetical protein